MERKNKSSEGMRKGIKKKLKTAKEASLPFSPRGTPNNLKSLQKFKVPDFRDISVTLIAPHRHSFSHGILSFLPGKQKAFVGYLLSHKRVSIKKNDFLLFVKQRVFSIL